MSERLAKALIAEADRRQALGHYAIAHELRGDASAVRRAASALEASKRVRK